MRRRFSRRRRPMQRWFKPDFYSGSSPTALGNFTTGVPAPSIVSDVMVSPLLFGSAPFPGVANSAGRIAGTILAERQWWTVRRIVGRLSFVWHCQTAITPEIPGDSFYASVHWGIMKWKTEEDGTPTSPMADPSNVDDMDERWVYRDVWREHVTTTGLAAFEPQDIIGPEPFGSYIDITTRRVMRNEEDLWFVAKFSAHWFAGSGDSNFPSANFLLDSFRNLRILGGFSR